MAPDFLANMERQMFLYAIKNDYDEVMKHIFLHRMDDSVSRQFYIKLQYEVRIYPRERKVLVYSGRMNQRYDFSFEEIECLQI